MPTESGPLVAALERVPAPICEAFEREYGHIESRFSRGDWSPAELRGGRLAEALFRYLQWKSTGDYTPLGKRLNRSKISGLVKNDTDLPDGIRFHLRRCAELLMDVRNRRDVAHLGKEIDFYEMDARLVMRLASWSLSEIVREEGELSSKEIQRLIDRMSATHLPLVEEIGGDLVVLATHLTAADQALVALYHTYPKRIDFKRLFTGIRYEHRSRFRKLLEGRAEDALIHMGDEGIKLTRKGVEWVERNIELQLVLE